MEIAMEVRGQQLVERRGALDAGEILEMVTGVDRWPGNAGSRPSSRSRSSKNTPVQATNRSCRDNFAARANRRPRAISWRSLRGVGISDSSSGRR